ncbi:MAG: acyl-CoA desaturase [Deltaproteobacteria bacterium]|nr:acyl-CoA desaturase [Deltaproteobacteria bacterium]
MRFNPWTALALVVYHLLALAALALPWRWEWALAGLGVFLWAGLGTTVGLHRLLSHRAFQCPKWLEYFLVTGAATTLQTAPLEWAANHRTHHGYSDKDGDPHSPRFGVFYAHLGWVIDDLSTDRQAWKVRCKDLANDRYYLALQKFRFWPHLALVAVVALTAGWQALPAIVYLPCKVWMHAAYSVNSVCHLPSFGSRGYETPDTSRNVWWVGLWGLGEGWHNNHHAHPRRAFFGEGWRQPDAGSAFLKLMSALGLVWGLRSGARGQAEPEPGQ